MALQRVWPWPGIDAGPVPALLKRLMQEFDLITFLYVADDAVEERLRTFVAKPPHMLGLLESGHAGFLKGQHVYDTKDGSLKYIFTNESVITFRSS